MFSANVCGGCSGCLDAGLRNPSLLPVIDELHVLANSLESVERSFRQTFDLIEAARTEGGSQAPSGAALDDLIRARDQLVKLRRDRQACPLRAIRTKKHANIR